jgi:hypothetical protein
MKSLREKKISNYDILMHHTSDEIQKLAESYGENLAIKACVGSLSKLN